MHFDVVIKFDVGFELLIAHSTTAVHWDNKKTSYYPSQVEYCTHVGNLAKCSPIFKNLEPENQHWICTKVRINDPATTEMCSYSTLWNIWHLFDLQ